MLMSKKRPRETVTWPPSKNHIEGVVFLLEPHNLKAIILRGSHVDKQRNKANLRTVPRKEPGMLSLTLGLPGK